MKVRVNFTRDPVLIQQTLDIIAGIKKIAGIVTYGRPRLTAFYMGDPPRKIVTRYVRWFAARGARVDYHALYHLNVATLEQRRGFSKRVDT